MDDQEKLKRAKQQVAAMTGFYIHAACFVVVMVLLLVINVLASASWWVQWPFLGWGVFVVMHGIAVFGQLSSAISNWQRRKVDEIVDRM